MLVVRLFVVRAMLESTSIGMEYGLNWFQFILLLIVAALLAAAGNVINDYFDQKVDRINKPDKVIVGKTVKRRVAIILHQTLNIIALLITIYLCMITSFWWPIAFPFLIATLLWWYSPVLKKKAFSGNLAIAVCTAAVPLWAGIYEVHELKERYFDMLIFPETFFGFIWLILLSLSAFAFILTLVREAQKDMEDLQGDTEGGYNTMPIRFGVVFTKKYVYSLLTLYILAVAFFLYRLALSPIAGMVATGICALLLLLPTFMSFAQTMRAQTPSDFHRASFYTKWMMIAGLVAFCVLSVMMR